RPGNFDRRYQALPQEGTSGCPGHRRDWVLGIVKIVVVAHCGQQGDRDAFFSQCVSEQYRLLHRYDPVLAAVVEQHRGGIPAGVRDWARFLVPRPDFLRGATQPLLQRGANVDTDKPRYFFVPKSQIRWSREADNGTNPTRGLLALLLALFSL